MISREEVAKKLRGSGEWLFGYSYNAAAVKAIGILRDATDSTYNYATLLDRLADLIDPTCHDFGGEEGTNGESYDFACSACGWCGDVTKPNYCPHCGARVVRDES